MAAMMDQMPSEYEGERTVWKSIKENLPDDIVCYYNREVKGREFDFCLLIKDIGLLVIEVKGWNKHHITSVKSPDEIILADGSVSKSPKKQARSYSFSLKNVLSDHYSIDPLVMNMVCYPFLSEHDYRQCGLNIVSEPELTLFSDDISTVSNFTRKIFGVYQNYDSVSCDKMSGKTYDIVRHHFEPSYIIQPPAQNVLPYSCLSVFAGPISSSEINQIIRSYCSGTKQIVFTNDINSLNLLAKQLSDYFTEHHICIRNGNLSINTTEDSIISINTQNNRITVFNFEAILFNDKQCVSAFIAYNGNLSDEQRQILKKLSKETNYNINQFEIEHAPVGRDIQVKAGAGTGKTYSMVSRIAFLCSQASGSGIFDPSTDIAMLTFTADAALNMKSRIKQLFINYFVLTKEIRYLEIVTNIEKMRISTIHSFAKDIISATSITLGIGTDFTTIVGKYDKQKIFDRIFTEYLEKMNERSPLFFEDLPMRIENFRKYLLEVAGKLYEKGCDIKTVSMDVWGTPPEKIPYLNELFENVVIETEKEYASFLVDNNAVVLSEYMMHLRKCIADDSFNTTLFAFKYIFIDEFQDTDDAQIAAFIDMQKKIGFNLFIVGDLKQSIYRFRGATMTAFEKMGCSSDSWLSFSLNINYRSDKRLLEEYEKVFSSMGNHNLLKYVPEEDSLSGVKICTLSADELVACYPYHSSDKTKTSVYYDKLFDVIRGQQERIKREMQKHDLSEKERIIAVLARKNRQVDEILREAKKRNIVMESDNNSDLYRLAPCIDLCRLTAALCNPYNPTYLFDLINSNNVNVRLDLKTIIGKTDEEKTDIFIRCLDQFYQTVMKKTWADLINDIQNEPILKTLRMIYEAVKPWSAYSSDTYRQDYYRANYDLIFEELSEMNKRSYLTLDSINESLHINIMTGTEAKSREISISTDDVRLIGLTVHKSKGLEYGTVILPCTEDEMDRPRMQGIEMTYIDGKIGYCISSGRNHFYNNYYPAKTELLETMREESRILYVAMTRAINNFIWFDDVDSIGNSWGRILREL